MSIVKIISPCDMRKKIIFKLVMYFLDNNMVKLIESNYKENEEGSEIYGFLPP